MSKKKVLFICQEIYPYVPESEMSTIGRSVPQMVQEKGCEIRTFMPKWGIINERRNQLHEVIRLSGMNIVIDDTDHPLIIKVASIQAARMQVYFIDNEEFFYQRKMLVEDDGKENEDCDERAIFYARGVLETVKKLRWVPDVIHCHGWMSAAVPVYLRKVFNDDPAYANCKIVYSVYSQMPQQRLGQEFGAKLAFRDLTVDQINADGIDYAQDDAWQRLMVKYVDAVVAPIQTVSPTFKAIAEEYGVKYCDLSQTEHVGETYKALYEELLDNPED